MTNQRAVFLILMASCHDATTPQSAFVPDSASVADSVAVSDSASDSAAVADSVLETDSGAASIPVSMPDMLLVPAGTFTMGDDRVGEEDEHPAHSVTLPAFWLDKTHVTNEAYAKCVAASKCPPSDRFVASRSRAGKDEDFLAPHHPVVGVSWDNARAYCAWREKRLPREAEFERAIRDDDGRKFPWGNDAPTPDKAVFGRIFGSPNATTDDVGMHHSGRGPFGHDDLVGNVWEWCDDEYDPYAYRRKTADRGVPGTCAEILATLQTLRKEGKQGFTGSNPIPVECEHVLRGGAFNYDAHGLRATNRVHHPGRFRIVMAGFRCAKDI